MSYLPDRASKWLDGFWPREKRRPFLRWLCLIGFGVASFQAFDHVNTELKSEKLTSGRLTADLKGANDQLAETRRLLAEANKWIPSVTPRYKTTLMKSKNTNIKNENMIIQGFDNGFEPGTSCELPREQSGSLEIRKRQTFIGLLGSECAGCH